MRIFIALVLMAGFLACGNTNEEKTTEKAAPAEQIDLSGNWRLIDWQKKGETLPPARADSLEDIQLAFDFGKNQIVGFSGCNRYMAGFQIEENRLAVDAPGGTRMGCPGPQISMQRELTFLAQLHGAEAFEQLGDRLIIHGLGESKLMFERDK